MMAASTSRARVIGSLLFINTGNNIADLRGFRSHIFTLGGHRAAVLAFEGGHDGVPGQNGAFDTSREFMHARENRQLADISHDLTVGNHFMDLVEHGLNLSLRLAFYILREERGGG